MRYRAIVAASQLFAAVAANAQQPADTSACNALPAPDTALGVAFAQLNVSPRNALPKAYLTEFLLRLREPLSQAPAAVSSVANLSDVTVTALGGRGRGGPRVRLMPRWPGRPELTSEYQFTLRPDGRVEKIRDAVIGDPPLHARIRLALEAVDAGPFPTGSTSPVSAYLRLGMRIDSAATISEPLIEIAATDRKATPPRILPNWRSGPRYPDVARMENVEASLIVWLDVDARGNVVKRSVGAATSADGDPYYPDFVATVKSAFSTLKFDPARIGNCAVPQRVVLSVFFKIAG